MTTMVFGRIASVIEKQESTLSVMLTFIVARQASMAIVLA